jgi:DNA phosphorothioation-associated DGQHR protein 1
MNAFPAIRILQPLGEFYLTAIPAEVLLNVCFSHRHTRHEADDSGRVRDDGHQRRLDPKRLSDISRFLQTQDAALPGTIIIAANCTQDGEILVPDDEISSSRRWRIEPKDKGEREVVSLIIPSDDKLGAVVDGQHRLWGFEGLPADLRKTSLPCAVFLDLPTPQQAAIFATINFNQKPVSKSQSYELFGYNLDDEPERSWSPDKLAVFFARKLNVDSESPFKDHIKVAAQDDRVLDEIAKDRKKEWSVSTATIVEGILSLISKNPKQDRDILHRDPVEARSRKILGNAPMRGDVPPFRVLYLAEDRDIVIYKTLLNFFNAVNKLFWADLHADSKSLIRKTAGVQALFQVLKELLPAQLVKKELQQLTWEAVLGKAGSFDFANNNVLESSGRGRARIRDAILVAIGKKQLTEIQDEQFRNYLQQAVDGVKKC